MGKPTDLMGKRSDYVFIENKYTAWYFSIIETAKKRQKPTGYTEKHHIIPKALGGSNDISNLVILTAKEHYIVHHLLTKMITNSIDEGKMWSAYFLMHIGHKDRVVYPRNYTLAKEQMAKHKSLLSIGEQNHFYGKTHTSETKQKMSNSWNRTTKRNHDTTLYTFTHEQFGTHYCTRSEICTTFNLKQKFIWKIVNKLQKTTGGWSIIWENAVNIQEKNETSTVLR